MAQPTFAGDKLEAQILGQARLELVQVDDQEVYFSVPVPEGQAVPIEGLIDHFILDPKRIVLAQEKEGKMRLGEYILNPAAQRKHFFKTSIDNLKVDPKTVLKFSFKQATYTIDLRELTDFSSNKVLFGGLLNADTGQTQNGSALVFANHGAFVAQSSEPSLGRFVRTLTQDIPEDDRAREARVQRVLDFVSQEIAYNFREASYQVELLKRPNEVLFSGESDCSNKTILLGSLLEQLGEDYLFVYLPKHITIAVRQGKFPKQNGLGFEWQGTTWLIAESTAAGFQIGRDRLNNEALFQQLQYVQRPKDKNKIFNAATGQQLSFR